MNMPELWVTVLIGVAAVLFAGAAGMVGLGVSNVVSPFLVEVKEESAGGVAGAGSVVVRKLGVMNRRFMWPGYEDKMRRSLIKAGEPKTYKPEDIMALQEIGFIVGLMFGVVLASAIDFKLAWSLVVA